VREGRDGGAFVRANFAQSKAEQALCHLREGPISLERGLPEAALVLAEMTDDVTAYVVIPRHPLFPMGE